MLWDFSGIICFLYTDTQLLAKVEGSFVIFLITPELFHLTVWQAINFSSKRDITDALAERHLGSRQKTNTCLKKCQNVDVPPII